MINIGKYNVLEVKREVDFGHFLGDFSKNEVLLPKSHTKGMDIQEGDQMEVFVYKDSKGRPVATLKKPLATVGEVAYLKATYESDFGVFVDFGLERDILVPFKEQRFKLKLGSKYLFYIYLDKTERLAATTKVDEYILNAKEEGAVYELGQEVVAQVYSRSENGTLNVAIDGKYRGIILPNEYYTNVFPGTEMKLRVKKLYEDGIIGLTPRQNKLDERSKLQNEILRYLEANNGFMKFNDKSSPEEIKETFNTSKNYFKIALGGLMKERLITQDKEGTTLIKKEEVSEE